MEERQKKQDYRVNVKSKKIVLQQLAKYKNLLQKMLDSQSRLSEEDREKLSQEMLRNFEHLVQENIAVDGLSWKEAAEENGEDYEFSILDDMLDENIVQTTRKRSIYPKKILPYVVRCLKAERKLMGLFENTVKPQVVKRDPAQDTIMNNVSAAAPRMFKEASTVVKSLATLNQRAEGLNQVLNMQPSAETVEVYREVFGNANGENGPVKCNRAPVNRYTIKRAVAEAEYSMDYIPKSKILTTALEND